MSARSKTARRTIARDTSRQRAGESRQRDEQSRSDRSREDSRVRFENLIQLMREKVHSEDDDGPDAA
jgi:hypothetical protein